MNSFEIFLAAQTSGAAGWIAERASLSGVDGAGAAFSLVDSPNFDRIFADNAYRHDAVTEYITTSAQNWGSILTGVDYNTHGFTNDSLKLIERNSSAPNNDVCALVLVSVEAEICFKRFSIF